VALADQGQPVAVPVAECNSVADVAAVVQRDISFVGLLAILGLLVLPILRGIGCTGGWPG
jgi:hypothetical protein